MRGEGYCRGKVRVTVWDPLRSGDDSNPSGRPSLSQSRNALPHNRRQDQVCQSEFSSPLEPLLLVFRDNRRGFRVATPSERVEPSESDWNENRERMPRMVERERTAWLHSGCWRKGSRSLYGWSLSICFSRSSLSDQARENESQAGLLSRQGETFTS